MKTISTTRRTFVGGATTLTLGAMLAACGGNNTTDTTSTTEAPAGETTSETTTAASGSATYNIMVQGYDWGAGVNKAILTLPEPIDAISADDLKVSETKQITDFAAEGFPVIETTVERTIEKAYLLDATGEEGTSPSTTVCLDLACSPDEGSPFLYSMGTGFNTWSDPYYLTIEAAEGSPLAGVTFAKNPDTIVTMADIFSFDQYKAGDITYQYASFAPEGDSKTLVVWLHGAGEGGTVNTDPKVTLLANKVTALASDKFQAAVGGAHVLVPQCPTMWMDIDGKSTYIDTENSTEVNSYYTESVEELIDSYAAKIGAEKILLCGCSNGGFMTLWLAMHRPEAYAGIVPICEAVPDALITDEQIASLVDLPMYFVYSKDDETVVPSEHEEPTIERLRAAGKTDETLHVSTTDHVVDTSGEVKDKDGNPYQYNGHWSWIYFDNNECKSEDGMLAWDFMGECVK